MSVSRAPGAPAAEVSGCSAHDGGGLKECAQAQTHSGPLSPRGWPAPPPRQAPCPRLRVGGVPPLGAGVVSFSLPQEQRLRWSSVQAVHEESVKGVPSGSVVRSLPADAGDAGLIPGSGRSFGGGDGNPLQYSCLQNPMDRGAWQATVHGGHEKSDATERAHVKRVERNRAGAEVSLQHGARQSLGGSSRAGTACQSGRTLAPLPFSVPGCREGGRYVGLGRTLQDLTAGGCPLPWCECWLLALTRPRVKNWGCAS